MNKLVGGGSSNTKSDADQTPTAPGGQQQQQQRRDTSASTYTAHSGAGVSGASTTGGQQDEYFVRDHSSAAGDSTFEIGEEDTTLPLFDPFLTRMAQEPSSDEECEFIAPGVAAVQTSSQNHDNVIVPRADSMNSINSNTQISAGQAQQSVSKDSTTGGGPGSRKSTKERSIFSPGKNLVKGIGNGLKGAAGKVFGGEETDDGKMMYEPSDDFMRNSAQGQESTANANAQGKKQKNKPREPQMNYDYSWNCQMKIDPPHCFLGVGIVDFDPLEGPVVDWFYGGSEFKNLRYQRAKVNRKTSDLSAGGSDGYGNVLAVDGETHEYNEYDEYTGSGKLISRQDTTPVAMPPMMSDSDGDHHGPGTPDGLNGMETPVKEISGIVDGPKEEADAVTASRAAKTGGSPKAGNSPNEQVGGSSSSTADPTQSKASNISGSGSNAIKSTADKVANKVADKGKEAANKAKEVATNAANIVKKPMGTQKKPIIIGHVAQTLEKKTDVDVPELPFSLASHVVGNIVPTYPSLDTDHGKFGNIGFGKGGFAQLGKNPVVYESRSKINSQEVLARANAVENSIVTMGNEEVDFVRDVAPLLAFLALPDAAHQLDEDSFSHCYFLVPTETRGLIYGVSLFAWQSDSSVKRGFKQTAIVV